MRILAAGFAFASIGLSLFGVPAQAAGGACTTAAGVTVIVDASALGGEVSQRCTDGEPSSGLDALTRAGYSWISVSRSPVMVCRINGLPSTDQTGCIFEPPANAYWMYFRSTRGGTWSYSQLGAHTKPEPGAVEGWVFYTGFQREPSLPPPAPLPVETPTPTPAAPTQTPTPTKKPHRPSQRPAPTTAGQELADTLPGFDSESQAPTPGQRSASGAIQAPAQNKAMSPPLPIPDTQPAQGSPLSAIVGIGTALVLAAVAITMEIRRRLNDRPR